MPFPRFDCVHSQTTCSQRFHKRWTIFLLLLVGDLGIREMESLSPGDPAGKWSSLGFRTRLPLSLRWWGPAGRGSCFLHRVEWAAPCFTEAGFLVWKRPTENGKNRSLLLPVGLGGLGG